MQTGNINQCHT